MMTKKIQSNAGLTLVETLVAISVLLMSVVGPMVIYARNISDARFAGNQITAYYLAQEAIEFVKYKVYTNKNDPSNPDWLDGLGACIDKDCYIDSVNNTVTSCGESCPFVQIDSGLYNYSVGAPTIFTRRMQIIGGASELSVKATVFFTSGGVSKSIEVQENIFGWQP